MKAIMTVIVSSLLMAMSSAAREPAKPDVVAFNAIVKVEVDAAGKPVTVEASADLPQAIRDYIEKRVASWHYEPAKVGGVAASAMTYVQVGACAIPDAGGQNFRLGLDFKGNGPKIIAVADRLTPPYYPPDARRGGATGTFKVSYDIQPDGSTKLKSIDVLEQSNGRFARLFRSELTKWVESLRYEPESVNGHPVSTEMAFPVEFSLGDFGSGAWRKAYLEELKMRAITSKECMAASGGAGLLPVAVDSPVKIIPSPAG